MFCFPYAGGGASIFRNWPKLIPQTIELLAVQLPGREGRFHEAPRKELAGIVHDLVCAVAPFLDRPYVTFGHSLGTILSYELILALWREGLALPRHAFMSARGAPSVRRDDRGLRHLLPDDLFIEALRRMQGTDDELLHDQELMQLLMPTIRADFALAETYTRDLPTQLPCAISVYGGTDDEEVRPEHLTAWQSYTSRQITCTMFRGGHFFINTSREDVVQHLLKDLLTRHGTE
jgi:surfactin synthase thioesterase subunit